MRCILTTILLLPLLGSTLATQEKVDETPKWARVTLADGSVIHARSCIATRKYVYGVHSPVGTDRAQVVAFENGKPTPVTLPDGTDLVPVWDKASIAGDCVCVVANNVLYRVDAAKARPVTLDGKALDMTGSEPFWATQTATPLVSVLSAKGARVFSLSDTVATEVSLPDAARRGMALGVDGPVMCFGGPKGTWLIEGTTATELLDVDEDEVRAQHPSALVGDLFLYTWNRHASLCRVEKNICHQVELPEGSEATRVFRLGERVLVQLQLTDRSIIREWRDGNLIEFAPVKNLDVRLAGLAPTACVVAVTTKGESEYYRLDESSCRPLKFPERMPFFEYLVSHEDELLASLGKHGINMTWMPGHIETSGRVRFAATADGELVSASSVRLAAGPDGFYAFCEYPTGRELPFREAAEVWFCKYK